MFSHDNRSLLFKDLIDHIRVTSHSAAYATSMSPPVVEQIVSVLNSLLDNDEEHEGRFDTENVYTYDYIDSL